jgi:hypothetical protein
VITTNSDVDTSLTPPYAQLSFKRFEKENVVNAPYIVFVLNPENKEVNIQSFGEKLGQLPIDNVKTETVNKFIEEFVDRLLKENQTPE